MSVDQMQGSAEAHGDERAALERLAKAVECELDPDWECNSYHPSLSPALKHARAVLKARPNAQRKGTATTDEQIIAAWDAWPDALINNRRRAIAFVRSLPEQAPAPAQRYAADLADTIQQVANAIGYAGQDPEALIAKVRALAAQVSEVARGDGIREALERAAVTGGAAADSGIDGAGVAAAIRALADSFEPAKQKQP